MTLAERWALLWSELQITMPVGATADAMLARYGEPQRFYHTVQHLEECIAWFDQARSFARQPLELELALWYHDAVYDPRRNDNEEASARLAAEHLGTGGAPPRIAADVSALILWTTHAAEPPEGDAALLVDIDLAILGSTAERYAEYERQIREEYAWVPAVLFRRRRAALLERFLARPRLYVTPVLRDRLEERARANLVQSLATLRGRGRA